MVIDNEYEIGDIVYLKTDEEQAQRMVVFIKVFKDGELVYSLSRGTIESQHYSFEISKEKTYINT